MRNRELMIKRIFFLVLTAAAIVYAFVASPLANGFGQKKEVWQSVKRIEGMIAMPDGAHPLSLYDRYYAKGEGKDTGFIVGIFRYNADQKGDVHIVKYSSLPIVFDGGCNVVRIRYSVDNHRIESAECNGEA
jgi:hypothetical protein